MKHARVLFAGGLICVLTLFSLLLLWAAAASPMHHLDLPTVLSKTLYRLFPIPCLIGAVVAWRRPDLPLGWLLLGAAGSCSCFRMDISCPHAGGHWPGPRCSSRWSLLHSTPCSRGH
jgi:hypothetical protein